MLHADKLLLSFLFIFIASFCYATPISSPFEASQEETHISKKDIRKNKKADRKQFRKRIKTALQNSPKPIKQNVFLLVLYAILFLLSFSLFLFFVISGSNLLSLLLLLLLGVLSILGIIAASITIRKYNNTSSK